MLHWADSPVTDDEWSTIGGDDAADLPILSRHGDGPMTIPSFKFGSNDGWLVTPEEIAGALEAWAETDMARDHLAADRFRRGMSTKTYETISEDYWRQWIEFLRRAKDRGGFQVW
jgi:hypothetical protein